MPPDSDIKKRAIRSFVLRQGRMTASQQQALETLWPVFGVEYRSEQLDLDALFGRQAPRYLEIGFGRGDSLADMAAQHAEHDYLGIEVHRPGVGHLLIRIDKEKLGNIRIINHDAVEVLEHMIPPASLDGLFLFFPDPWHKKKHHKRRIVQPAFVELIASRLKPGGILHMATDWQEYADHMLEIMAQTALFENTAADAVYAARGERPQTKYESRGEQLGHVVHDLVYRKR
jgi:tRNA (guanine-N7-)-methyltransferase